LKESLILLDGVSGIETAVLSLQGSGGDLLHDRLRGGKNKSTCPPNSFRPSLEIPRPSGLVPSYAQFIDTSQSPSAATFRHLPP
jgi:hypothetical protein